MSRAILQVKNLCKEFRSDHRSVQAVDHVSFTLSEGEVLGLVGESGSGKSTIARLITQLEKSDSGEILLNGEDYSHPCRRQLRTLRGKVQMVFQDAEGSFNPRMKIGTAILESIRNFHDISPNETRSRMEQYLHLVGLNPELCSRYPRELSGGQCQRAAIVRALVSEPQVLICDEATSALDVLVQARIMELFRDLQKKTNMSVLFISHDLALVSSICQQILILRGGRCVEQGATSQIITSPQCEYTKNLLNSIL